MTGGSSVRFRIPVAAALILAGCGDDAPQPPASTRGPAPDARPDRNFEDRVYERNVVFMTVGADSAIIVPWLFRSSTSDRGVERVAEAWLARSGLWEPFFTDRWDSPSTRSPFRIHPRGAMDLVVGPDDVLEEILYEEGPRKLEVIIDGGMSDWSGSRGETFRVHQGAAHFGNLRIEGMVLDMSRVHLREGPIPGEWMFVTGPGRLALMIEATGESPRYSGWGRRGEEEYRWPDIDVEWTSVRSFEEARRDVPVAWEIRSGDGEMALALASAGMELRAGEGLAAQNSRRLLFGVGAAAGADSVRVRWPSGRVDEVGPVEAGTLVKVRERGPTVERTAYGAQPAAIGRAGSSSSASPGSTTFLCP